MSKTIKKLSFWRQGKSKQFHCLTLKTSSAGNYTVSEQWHGAIPMFQHRTLISGATFTDCVEKMQSRGQQIIANGLITEASDLKALMAGFPELLQAMQASLDDVPVPSTTELFAI